MFGPPYALKAITNTSFKNNCRLTSFMIFVFFFAKMNKNNCYTRKISRFGLFAFSLLFMITACTNHKEELAHLSELTDILEANKKNFDLDIPLFETRKEFIESTLNTFRNNYTDTMSLELGNSLSRYKAIKKIYNKNISAFNENLKDQEELEKQLENLKTDLKNNKLTKEEFKAYYNTEKMDVLALVNSCKNVKKILYQVEPDYKRVTEEVIPLLESLED